MTTANCGAKRVKTLISRYGALRRVVLLSVLWPGLAPWPAFAALGESDASVEADRQSVGGVRTSAPESSYSIETITTTGLTIREYVTTDGMVFAVSWRGVGVPDLSLLLGGYFEEYENARLRSLRQEPKVRGPLAFATADLIVETGGHMRDLWGRAVLRPLMPRSVTLQDIQ